MRASLLLFPFVPVTFVLVAFAGVTVPPAVAHDWYTGMKDPVTRKDCCGERDCHRLDPEGVVALSNGDFLIRAYNWRIPRDRVQASPDLDYHICEGMRLGRRGKTENQFRLEWECFFAPAGAAQFGEIAKASYPTR